MCCLIDHHLIRNPVLKFIGCHELHSKGVSFLPKAWPGVDQLFLHNLGVDAPRLLLSDIFISRRLDLVLSTSPVMTFTSGPQSQPIRFHPQFPVASSLNVLSSLHFSHVSCFAVDIHIHSKLSIKMAAIPCSRLRRLFPVFSFSSIGYLLFH